MRLLCRRPGRVRANARLSPVPARGLHFADAEPEAAPAHCQALTRSSSSTIPATMPTTGRPRLTAHFRTSRPYRKQEGQALRKSFALPCI